MVFLFNPSVVFTIVIIIGSPFDEYSDYRRKLLLVNNTHVTFVCKYMIRMISKTKYCMNKQIHNMK